MTAAASALERGEPARARRLLEPVRPYDHAPSPSSGRYLRGQADLQLKDGPAAADQFRAIVDRRGEVPTSMFYPLAHLGLGAVGGLTTTPNRPKDRTNRS